MNYSKLIMMKKNQYKDGERDGYWEDYWSNGKPCFKGNYLNGKEHGLWRYYRLYGGGLWSMGYQKNGERIGYWEKCYNQRRNIKQFYI